MADVSIDASVVAVTARVQNGLVWTTVDIGYFFYFDGDGTFGYSKTTDGGATWGAQVEIAAATTHIAADVWFDKWTPGDTGTLIHTAYFDVTSDDLFYRTLDTNGDTLGTQRLINNETTAVAGRGTFISITKARSGYLYAAWDVDAGAERGFFRSIDGGINWSDLSATFVEATLDTCQLFPASNTGDDDDCWAIYYDADATALTLKMWDSSAGSPTESATIGGAHTDGATDLTGQTGFSGAIRFSDGHLILARISQRDAAGASDFEVFDINGTGSITQLTDIQANTDDCYHPQIFIDQNTNDLYVAYNGARAGTEVLGTTTKVYYTKSTNGGTSWSAGDTAYMEGAAGVVVQVWTPPMGPRFYAAWRVGTTLLGNKVNSIAFLTQSIAGAFRSAAAALFAGVVTAGAVSLAGATIASGAQLFAGTVTQPVPFDSIRQDIIDGLVSAQSETNGWNAQRANIPVSAVVRTSDTVVTITLPALPGYDITADETITATIPASALVGGAPIIATPTFSITNDAALSVGGAHIGTTQQLFAGTVTTGAVNVDGAHRASTAQLFAGTTTVGAVSVTGATLASTAQLFSGTVTVGAASVTGSHLASTAQLFSGSVTVGAVEVVGAHRASTTQLFAGDITQGGVTVNGDTIPAGSQLFAGSVTVGAVSVTGDTIAAGSQTFSGVVTGTQSVTGAFLSSTTQLFSGAVTTGAVSVAGETVSSTTQLFAGTVTTGAVSVTGAHQTSTVVLFSGTLSQGGVFVDGATIPSGTALFSGSVTTGAVSVTGATITTTTQMFAGTVAVSQSVTGAHRASTAQLFAGTVTAGATNVDGALIPSGAQLFPGAVSAGALAVVGSTITTTVQTFPGVVSFSFPQDLDGSHIASGAQIFGGMLVAPEIIQVPGSYQTTINVPGSYQSTIGVAGEFG